MDTSLYTGYEHSIKSFKLSNYSVEDYKAAPYKWIEVIIQS